MAVDLKTEIQHYLKAGFPALYVQTHEEDRAIEQIEQAAKTIKRRIVQWTVTRGWYEVLSDADGKSRVQTIKEDTDPRESVSFIGKHKDDTVYVMKDFSVFLEEPSTTRAVRDIIPICKATGRTLVITSPRVLIPVDLEKDITLVELDLPTTEQLERIFESVVESVGAKTARVENKEKMLEAAKGLTAFEAEQTYSFALVRHGNLSNEAIKTVMREKASVIKKTGILEFFEHDIDMGQIGGNDAFKSWLMKRRKAFTAEAVKYGLRKPRGVLIVGVQGCGKSTLAKAIANLFMQPLLRLDVGRVFGALVGQSEGNMRGALSIAEAIAPCTLWLDELEKGLAGLQSSGQTDSGVTARVFGTMLTWMAEKKTDVNVVATCNDISALPAEAVRKGRFDEIWFVDLPNQIERGVIFEIHLHNHGRDPKKFDVGRLAVESDRFTGAEIEEAINSAMFDAFDEGKEVTTEHILHVIKMSPPIAVTAPEKIERVRNEQAKNKWRRATEVVQVPAQGRRVNVKD